MCSPYLTSKKIEKKFAGLIDMYNYMIRTFHERLLGFVFMIVMIYFNSIINIYEQNNILRNN